MLKPFVLSLGIAALGVATAAAGSDGSDVSVWRWSVSRILTAQHDDALGPVTAEGRVDAARFAQPDEPYASNRLADPGDSGAER